MLYKNLDYFELFIYILYIFFLKLKKILFFLIIPFKIIFNFSKIFFLILIIFKIEKSKKIFVDMLAVFYDMAYQEYELNHRLLMNYYLFLHLFPQKKLSSRKEIISIFEGNKKQEIQEYSNLLTKGYSVHTQIHLYPYELEEFFIKYRFIKKIGFFNYFIKRKREFYFYPTNSN